jgi:hypothetical protein
VAERLNVDDWELCGFILLPSICSLLIAEDFSATSCGYLEKNIAQRGYQVNIFRRKACSSP